MGVFYYPIILFSTRFKVYPLYLQNEEILIAAHWGYSGLHNPLGYYPSGAYRIMKIIGKVITKRIIDKTGKVFYSQHTYNVQAIVELGGKPAYVTTKIQERYHGWNEYLVIAHPLVEDYIPADTCPIVQTHYELECKCKPDAVEVCKSCKLLLQTMYPEIPFEGEGI